MTDDKKKELLKNKFMQIIQTTMQSKDPNAAETDFIKFYNAVKDNEDYFLALAGEEKLQRQQALQQLQDSIVVNETKIAEIDQVIAVADVKPKK